MKLKMNISVSSPPQKNGVMKNGLPKYNSFLLQKRKTFVVNLSIRLSELRIHMLKVLHDRTLLFPVKIKIKLNDVNFM